MATGVNRVHFMVSLSGLLIITSCAPHPYNYWRPLNELDILKPADNMPAKWQLLIMLGQQTILRMQENQVA